MVRKDKPSFYTSHHMTAVAFLIIGIVTTSILFAFPLLLNQNHIAIAQEQQLLNGNSFEMGKQIFYHRTASVNGVQLHYVIGGHGNPVVLLHGWPETWYEWRNAYYHI